MSEKTARTSRTRLAIISALALVGFYAITLPLAIGLILAPIALFVAWGWVTSQKHGSSSPPGGYWLGLMCFASMCAGGMLGYNVLRTRPSRFVAPGRELSEGEAPELFAALRELGAKVGTAPPDRIYLSAEPNLGVTEVDDALRRNERVLILGVPLLYLLTREELRAALAHELGHYLGGETRLSKVPSLTHALFRAALIPAPPPKWMDGTQLLSMVGTIHGAIGKLIALYARLYFGVTRKMSRAMEKEADRVASNAVGRDILRRSLEKTHVEAAVYDHYLQRDVSRAIGLGGFPSDLHEGFLRYRAKFVESDDGRTLLEKLRTEPTDRYDTHPALQERLAALDALPAPAMPPEVDERPALDLLSPDASHDLLLGTTFAEINAEHRASLVHATWADLPAKAFIPGLLKEAEMVAGRVAWALPPARGPADLLASLTYVCKGPQFYNVARALEPELPAGYHPELLHISRVIVARALAAFLRAALIQAGATLEPFLGETFLVFNHRGERIVPMELTANAVDGVPEAQYGLDRIIAMLNEAPAAS